MKETSGSKPLVSIIIPVFNQLDPTTACLESVETNTAVSHRKVRLAR